MTDKTKAVNLTEDEIATVIQSYGYRLGAKDYTDVDIERINYLNRRLKTFKEPETEVKSDNSAAGWSTNNEQS